MTFYRYNTNSLVGRLAAVACILPPDQDSTRASSIPLPSSLLLGLRSNNDAGNKTESGASRGTTFRYTAGTLYPRNIRSTGTGAFSRTESTPSYSSWPREQWRTVYDDDADKAHGLVQGACWIELHSMVRGRAGVVTRLPASRQAVSTYIVYSSALARWETSLIE